MIAEDKIVRESLMKCIEDALEEINTRRVEKIPANVLNNIYLYGQHGVFDSMQLINFLMIVEENIADRIGAAISIVSEKAVSRRVSPFRSVSTLMDYLLEEIGVTPATDILQG
jgi:hypothetical protein